MPITFNKWVNRVPKPPLTNWLTISIIYLFIYHIYLTICLNNWIYFLPFHSVSEIHISIHIRITLFQQSLFFNFLKCILLTYSWLQCCVIFYCTEKWFRYVCVYIYIYFFSFIFFSFTVYHRILKIVPVLYSRTAIVLKICSNIVRGDLYPRILFKPLGHLFSKWSRTLAPLCLL